jgi:hypothetical protein
VRFAVICGGERGFGGFGFGLLKTWKIAVWGLLGFVRLGRTESRRRLRTIQDARGRVAEDGGGSMGRGRRGERACEGSAGNFSVICVGVRGLIRI